MRTIRSYISRSVYRYEQTNQERKLYKFDEPDTQDTAGEARTSS